MTTNPEPGSLGSECVYDALVDAGVEILIGLPGTQTLPLDRTVAERTEMRYLMARHETAIPHIAWGYYETSDQMAATLTVPGPGDTNAAHGLKNALDDNVPLLHLSPIAEPEAFGKHPIHELKEETFDTIVKSNLTVETPAQLPTALARGVETALTPPYGPVRVGIPSPFLERTVEATDTTIAPEQPTDDTNRSHAEAIRALADAARPVLYVGGGARRSTDGPAVVSVLADRLDAPVLASYKGKGVFPEDADRFLGVSGADLPAGARAVLNSADVVLALGTDFDGPNTDRWSLPMGESLVHVDIDPSELDNAYESTASVVGDVATVVDVLLDRLRERDVTPTWDGRRLAIDVRDEYERQLQAAGVLAEGPPLPTPTVMRTVRDAVPREAIITTDIGGHRIWSKNTFEALSPKQFVTAGSWAGMGVGLPSAIGAKLAHPSREVLTLTGDGCLMMCTQELHTAAANNLNLTVVLFNDADYGIISKSSKLEGPQGELGFGWDSPDWIAVAEGFGCEARRASTRNELETALEWAQTIEKPTLLDVDIDSAEPTPAKVASYETAIDPSVY
jgi:acetolactate synthase-1/2/3 large subunit